MTKPELILDEQVNEIGNYGQKKNNWNVHMNVHICMFI